ncbi:hypothetical protein MKK75_29595 [Methylobacterium sp. J-030]|nr:hypothetical protein [Methylobacterium sp. J-030]MCJ2072900.1 hypothetical protein [Methylobacterium sp. J-030]
MMDDAVRDDDGAPSDRPSRMRLIIGAGLMGMCLLGVLGGMLHILPA